MPAKKGRNYEMESNTGWSMSTTGKKALVVSVRDDVVSLLHTVDFDVVLSLRLEFTRALVFFTILHAVVCGYGRCCC